MTRSKGLKNRSRALLKKSPRKRGAPPPSVVLKEFSVGEKVVIDLEPSVHKGMPHRRFQGKVGTILEKRGRAYVVRVSMEPEDKVVVVRPAHLRSFSNSG
jgi:large subunit ribosomal protein L21e